STGTSAPSISTPQTGINPVNNSSNYYQSPLYVNPFSEVMTVSYHSKECKNQNLPQFKIA
ncbi:MAG: hypothetical protein AAF518_27415, partial [Spirochaetota bacterium]